MPSLPRPTRSGRITQLFGDRGIEEAEGRARREQAPPVDAGRAEALPPMPPLVWRYRTFAEWAEAARANILLGVPPPAIHMNEAPRHDLPYDVNGLPFENAYAHRQDEGGLATPYKEQTELHKDARATRLNR